MHYSSDVDLFADWNNTPHCCTRILVDGTVSPYKDKHGGVRQTPKIKTGTISTNKWQDSKYSQTYWIEFAIYNLQKQNHVSKFW